MDKLGTWVSPLETCINGSRPLHSVWSGILYQENSLPKLRIASLDAPLVAPGNASLLVWDQAQPALENGMHFNLHNNLWNTKCGPDFPVSFPFPVLCDSIPSLCLCRLRLLCE